jgi:hypothetical protein
VLTRTTEYTELSGGGAPQGETQVSDRQEDMKDDGQAM